MERKKRFLGLFLGIFLLLGTGPAGAQVEGNYVAEKPATPAEGSPAGWHRLLKAAANVSFSHNHNVVGNVDGSNWNIGSMINGGLGYLSPGGHSWENKLQWQLTYSQTPTFDRLLKSVDAFDFTSTYLYLLPSLKWLGPFAEAVLKTPVFPGYEVRTESYRVVRYDQDGNQVGSAEDVWAKNNIDLTGSFAPLLLKEAAGISADAVNRTQIKLNFRAGLSAWEVFARDGYTVADDAATPGILELKVIQDSTSLGGGAIAKATGALRPEVTYEAKAEAMYPFVDNIDSDLSGIDLLNVELSFLLQVKLQKWLSLDYTLKAVRVPFVLDKWQVQNNLLLSASYDLVK